MTQIGPIRFCLTKNFLNRSILPDNSKTLPDNRKFLPDDCNILLDNCNILPENCNILPDTCKRKCLIGRQKRIGPQIVYAGLICYAENVIFATFLGKSMFGTKLAMVH